MEYNTHHDRENPSSADWPNLASICDAHSLTLHPPMRIDVWFFFKHISKYISTVDKLRVSVNEPRSPTITRLGFK